MEDKKINEVKEENNSRGSKKNIIIFSIISLLVLIIIILSVIIVNLNKPLRRFKESLELDNLNELEKIYEEMETFAEKKEAEEMLKEKLENIILDYANEVIDYDLASGEIQKYKDMEKLSKYYKQNTEALQILKESKDIFINAEVMELDGNLIEAIKLYELVSKDDLKNYNIAQERMNELKITLKTNILEEVDKFVNNNDFVSAYKKLEEVKDVLKDDEDLTAKQNQIAEKAKEQEKEQAKNNQEISVISAKIVEQDSRYKSLYPDLMQVIVQNNTSKTVKSYTVSILGYDSNGFPLKIEGKYDYSGGVYEFLGLAEDANILAGKRSGSDRGWALDSTHNVSKIIAIVITAEYYDGTEWVNPYYEYWVEEYKEKPLN